MPDDLKEKSVIRLKANVQRETTGVFGLGGVTPQDFTAKFSFAISNGQAESTPETVTKTLQQSTASTIEAGEVELPRVKDGFDSYDLTMTTETTVGSSKQTNATVFRVWPLDVTIKSVFKDDGQKAPGFKHNILVSNAVIVEKVATAQATPEGDAELSRSYTQCGEVEITAVSPWVLESRKAPAKGRVWNVEVSKKPWTAKIHSHGGGKSEKAPHKQYVNLAQDFATGGGPLIKLEIGPEDLELGSKDEEIKVRATFPADNTKRTSPRPALWTGTDASTALTSKKSTAVPGVDELVYETVLKLPSDKGKAVCYLHMGVAGDKCKVEVGVTDTYEDDILYVQNYRMIALELLVPKLEHRQKASAIIADSGAELSGNMKKELNRLFEGTFIEFEFPVDGCQELVPSDYKKYRTGTGGTADITNPQDLFPASDKFKFWKYQEGWIWNDWVKESLTGGGDKVALLTGEQMLRLRSTKLGGSRAKHAMTWIFCDFIADRATESLSGGFNTVTTTITEKEKEGKQVDVHFQVFDYDPIQANGTVAVHKLRWRVTKWCTGKDWTWKEVSHPSTPQFITANTNWTDVGPFTNLTQRNKWVEPVDSVTLRIKLSTSEGGAPGALLGFEASDMETMTRVKYLTEIQVEVSCYGVAFHALGGALSGDGFIRTSGGNRTWQGTAKTFAHEIGHNLGQTYTAAVAKEAGGRSTQLIPGIPYGDKFPDGRYYVGHGHTGGHCAHQLVELMASASKTDKDEVNSGSFSRPSSTHESKYFSKLKEEKHCVMWGSGEESPTKCRDFCKDCKAHIRATDASDLSIKW